MLPRLTPGRLVRLCLKELRESLRDRRTIVTLVLMPLLVYPLLSLVLNRVLLTSITSNVQQTIRIAIGPELTGSSMYTVLQLGYYMLEDRDYAPVYLEEPVQDTRLPGTEKQTFPPALPRPQLIPLEGSTRQALRSGAVDLVISRRAAEDPDDEGNDSRNQRRKALRLLLQQTAEGTQLPSSFDPEAFLDLVGAYEVTYRQNDLQSERALQLVERMLASVNNEASRELLGGNFNVPFRLHATPMVMRSDYADLLATMVPLVLVLMTMAGAVYPAIDLTAGERERGTMEALIVSPTPSGVLLFAKYTAVVVVALLTALANLAAMTVTLWVSGIGRLVFGENALSTGVIGTVLALLVLFTMFFAALLLAVTSFAKSFKEAQAYLIPLMLLALTPGVFSLLPDVQFTKLLATVPLVNIVLLARQVLTSSAEWETAWVAVICNGIYAIAALAVASRLFGSDASMQGSQGSWRDLLLRPRSKSAFPSVDQMALTMAIMFPFYFVASSVLPNMSSDLATRLWLSSIVSFVLILGAPLFVAWYRRLRFATTFRLHVGTFRCWLFWLPATALAGGAAWMFAHEIFILGQSIGIGTIRQEYIEQVSEFRGELQALPLWLVLFAFAVTPAVCEEVLFRGFVLGSLRRYSDSWAICLSAILFGLMHVLTSNVLAIERFLPTTYMGLILGWLAIRTGSLWPGMIVHVLHNGLLLSLNHFQSWFEQRQILVEEGKHLPAAWLTAGALALLLAVGLIWISTRGRSAKDASSLEVDESDAQTPEHRLGGPAKALQ